VLSLDPFLMMRVSSSSLNSATGTSRRSITCVLKLVFLFSFRSIHRPASLAFVTTAAMAAE